MAVFWSDILANVDVILIVLWFRGQENVSWKMHSASEYSF